MSLEPAQRQFAVSKEPFPALVGGYGSGKTAAAIARAMALKITCRAQNIAYYLPTYPLIEDIAFQRFPELLERKGWAHHLKKLPNPCIEFPGAGKILFRTMGNPQRIVGYEVAHSICDELDTLAPDKARMVWNRIIARNRQKCGMRNSVGVVTTPEGFGFVYERWQKSPAPGYVLFRARTQDNAAHLDPDYIQTLKDSYPSALLASYLDGEFVNMAACGVYPDYDRAANATNGTIKDDEPLHIGMDFNVTKMAAAAFVLRDGKPLAVMEYTDVFDTPAMAKLIRARHPDHKIFVYPDASGASRKSANASTTDLQVLREAGFKVCVNSRNPAIKDRVLAVNAVIRSRDMRVNPDTCPSLVESLEKQAYDKHGEPDKTKGLDHIMDAAGYFIAYKFPLVRPVKTVITELRM